MSRALTLILAVLLTACGGGGDDTVPTPGVDCATRPELCV